MRRRLQCAQEELDAVRELLEGMSFVPPPEAWEPGDIVKITAAGDYKGRLATLVSRRGEEFWNLRVRRRKCDETSPVCYRKYTGLEWVKEGG